MLSEEQTSQIKQQLISQINSTFPEDKKQVAISQIEAMNSEQMENFLEQNNLIKTPNVFGAQAVSPASHQQCIFCSIADGKIHSYKIDENKDAVAVLEINPVSKGHIIIIPKKHISSKDKLPSSILTLAEKISKIIKSKLKPKKVEIVSSNTFGHEIMNVFPVYTDENINSERHQAKPEGLELLKNLLAEKPKTPTIKKPKPKQEKAEKLWLKERIP